MRRYQTFMGSCLFLISSLFLNASANPLYLVSAENFYGDIAQQIGAEHVRVTSLMSHVNQDPHLFSSSPSIAKAIANADLIVYNGIGYDSWIDNLIRTNTRQPRQIQVSNLLGKKMGDNPHIWYGPATMPLYAKQLVADLSQLDPLHAQEYHQHLAQFNKNNASLMRLIAHLKHQWKGTPITATEPIFNDMSEALGLTLYGRDFQMSIMNETEPSSSAIRNFENSLTQHAVKALIYNNQVTNPMTERMKELAKRAGIPIVGVSEMQPANQDYKTWMESELKALNSALERSGL